MMEEAAPPHNYDNEQYISNNQGYVNPTTLQIRLDTQPILDSIELFLRGKRMHVTEVDGTIRSQTIAIGVPKANDLGVQGILNFVTAIFNPQVVQGNFSSELYYQYVEQLHIDLATLIVLNCYDWDVHEHDIDLIIDFIINMIVPFISRLIDNGERKSYDSTIRVNESSTISKPKMFGIGG